ncbi:hypothetical protein BC826DRAFT_1036078 [Russula brevipes]|nr:hypothetical protein BC826DRAFT_1036078 [Russula brevipes]
MDDDIQFLGMVSPISSTKPSYAQSSHPSMQPPASGIMLVIPKSGDEPTQTLRFLKSRSAVVHIGRASSSVTDAEKSPIVYIIDLHSHHGTHLLRRDELVPRPIVPDVPIALQDGDTLTFGKAVGKEPYCVSPVTANVMLIYDTEAVLSPPISQPVISLVDSPSLPPTTIKGKESAEAPQAPNSGRYGLFGPHLSPSPSSPGSSSDDFSQSDPDGEEEEEEDDDDGEEEEEDDYLDPPEEYPSVPFGGHAQPQSTGACYASLPSLHGLGLLASRHVMHHAPPTYIPIHAPYTPSNTHTQMAPSLTLDRRSFIDPWLFDCTQRAGQDPPTLSLEARADEPMDISRPASPHVTNAMHPVPEVTIEQALAPGAQTETHINVNAEEPSIVGAYPGSPVRSVVVSPWESVASPQLDPQQQQPQAQLQNVSPTADVTAPSSVLVEASESSEQLVEDVASDVDAEGEADVDPNPVIGTNIGAPTPYEPGPLPVTTHSPAGSGANATSGITIDARLTSLDKALVNLWGNVLRMQIAHRKTQTDHKMLSDRTDALAARVDAVQADLRGDMPDDDEVDVLRTRVQTAEDLLVELQGRLSATEVALAEAKVQAEAQAVEQAAEVVVTEVSPCTHAPSALCAHSAQSDAALATSTITPATPTRKRKRTDDDGEGDDDNKNPTEREEDEQGNPVRECRPKVQGRKRPRRLARAATHTAVAAVVGAVAAWSALAFV